MTGKKLRRLLAVLSILVFTGLTGSPILSVQPAAAQSGGQVPGGWSGSTSDAEFWRAIRKRPHPACNQKNKRDRQWPKIFFWKEIPK